MSVGRSNTILLWLITLMLGYLVAVDLVPRATPYLKGKGFIDAGAKSADGFKALTPGEEPAAEGFGQLGEKAGGTIGKAMGNAFSEAFSGNSELKPEVVTEINAMSLPAGASDEDVRAYLNRLKDLTPESNWRSGMDPQVNAIKRLGSARVAIILQFIKNKSLGSYVEWALEEIADESNKQLILDNLERNSGLIQVVVKKGWAKDAVEIIKRKLPHMDGFGGDDWIDAAIACNDASMNEVLMENFFGIDPFFQDNVDKMYAKLIAIPGFPIAEFHQKWWERSGENEIATAGTASQAGLAVRNGVATALVAVAATWKQPAPASNDGKAKNDPNVIHQKLGQILDTAVPAGANTEDRADWVLKHRDGLTFDWQHGTYTAAI